MLVLTVKDQEAVIVGDGPGEVRVVLLEIARGKIRLGFVADKSIPIDREAVRRKKDAELGGEG